MIPDDKVQEVRERAAVLDIVSDYVSLRKSGANYQGLCPFHGEKTPSFNVNPGRGIFHCFGCGVGGNVVTFIMKIEGLAFPEAVKFLAKRVGVVIEDHPPTVAEQRRQDEREMLYRITELAAKYYRRVLLEDGAGATARRYLERRGVTAETSEAYRLGFAPDKWDGLTRHLEQKRVPLPLAEKLGLIRTRDGGGHYDTFRNRLLFTIADSQGRSIGFGGRVLDDSLPKYINSPESPIYHKSEVLFGVDLARQAMREQGAAIVVEGYFDHLALYQAGVRNVLATCGTALTPGHLKLLQRYAGKVYTLFDSDSAGRKATCRAMELFLGEALPASVVELPAGEDPDSFIGKEGQAAFTARVAAARPIFDWFFRDLLQQMETGSVEGKVRVVEELAPRLKKITDPLQQGLYISEVARVLGIDEVDLRKKAGLAPRHNSSSSDNRFWSQQEPRAGSGGKKASNSGVDTAEMLLALMGKYPEVARLVSEYGVSRLFPVDFLPVAEAILAQADSGQGIDWGLILEQVGSSEERSRLAALFVADGHLEEIDAIKMFDDLTKNQVKQKIDKEMKSLRVELNRENPESERYGQILKLLDDLRNKKSQLL